MTLQPCQRQWWTGPDHSTNNNVHTQDKGLADTHDGKVSHVPPACAIAVEEAYLNFEFEI